jgi:dTDP-4-dehydrorhamnose reductase
MLDLYSKAERAGMHLKVTPAMVEAIRTEAYPTPA